MRRIMRGTFVSLVVGIMLASQPAAAREPGCGGRAHDFKSTTRLRVVGLTADQRLVQP